jgi:hypothetical protein
MTAAFYGWTAWMRGAYSTILVGSPLTKMILNEAAKSKMAKDIFHGFPSLIDNLSCGWLVARQVGKDGLVYLHVIRRGAINGIHGRYDYYIRLVDRIVTHRFFKPRK